MACLTPCPSSTPLTCPGELLAAIMAGDRLIRCEGAVLRLENSGREVARGAMWTLRKGICLVSGEDGQSYRVQPMLDRMDITLALAVAQRKAGSRAAYAKQMGLTPSQISDVDNGRTPPSPAVLGALGLARLERFRPSPVKKKDTAA